MGSQGSDSDILIFYICGSYTFGLFKKYILDCFGEQVTYIHSKSVKTVLLDDLTLDFDRVL